MTTRVYLRFLEAAARRRQKAYALRSRGMKFKDIGIKLKCSTQRAQQLVNAEQASIDKAVQL